LGGIAAHELAGGPSLSASEMTTFLTEALALIETKHGFTGTVGHRFSGDLDDFPTGKARQFHFYTKAQRIRLMPGLPGTVFPPQFIDFGKVIVKDRTLPPFSETNAFVGEFATSAHESEPWPELNGADAGDTRSRVAERLRMIDSKGYALALVWPDPPETVGPGVIDPLKLTPEAQQGIIDFQKL
jgi:hypothetical protein